VVCENAREGRGPAWRPNALELFCSPLDARHQYNLFADQLVFALQDSLVLTLLLLLLPKELPPVGKRLVHNWEPISSPAPSASQRNHRCLE